MRFEWACYFVNVCSLCKCTGKLSQHREHCWDWLWKGNSLSLSKCDMMLQKHGLHSLS